MKSYLKPYLLTLLLLPLGACTGGALTDQFLADLSENGGAVEVQTLQHLHDGHAGEITSEGSKVFANDLGYEIDLQEAHVHFHQIKLISSGADPLCVGGMDQTVSLHKDHDLLGEDLLTHHLGTALIPMVFYCQFEIALGSEEHGAVKFDHSEGEGSEPTHSEPFHFSGTWSHGGDSGEFKLMGEHPISFQQVFQAKEGEEILEHPLHFHEGETVISVVLGTKYDKLFDGVDFKNQNEEEQTHTLGENFPQVIHQHLGEHHGSAGDDHGDHEHP